MKKQKLKCKEQERKTIKKNNGITLIALVITIIVLLILAGVTIATLTGENGILTRASEAKEETRGAEVEERVNLWKSEREASKYTNTTVKEDNELLEEMKEEGILFEEEINREDKIITIGNRVINYATEDSLTDIYVALYNDGTLVFNNRNNFDETKIVENGNFGNIKDERYVMEITEEGPNIEKAPPWLRLMTEGTNISRIEFASEILPNNDNIGNIFIGLDVTEIGNIENLNISNVTKMNNVFTFYEGTSIDFSKLDLSSVTDMSNMFYNSNITDVDLSKSDLSNVTNMSNMFFGSNITNVNLSGLDLSNVTDVSNMFTYSNTASVNLSGSDMGNLTNMNNMFNNSRVVSVDLSNLDTHNVTNMVNMFYASSNLTSVNLAGIDTSKVTDMGSMFERCRKLESIDVSMFDTSKVTDMRNMFYGCTALTNLNVSNFDVSNMITNPVGVQEMFREITIPITISSAWTDDMKSQTGYAGSGFIID